MELGLERGALFLASLSMKIVNEREVYTPDGCICGVLKLTDGGEIIYSGCIEQLFRDDLILQFPSRPQASQVGESPASE